MTMTTDNLSEFCAVQSVQTGEPLAGTAAKETTIWLVLEYAGPWGMRAVEENGLPTAVQAWLQAQSAALPDSRVLFVRHDREQTSNGRHFFVAITRESDQRLYRLFCATDEALLAVDVAELVADTAAQHPAYTAAPLFLVCTNGKRDQCCAKFGLPIYQQMAAELSAEQVWQCTHIGGHRYAATAVVLPHGVYYGQISSSRVPAIIAASQQGEVVLAGYRGRTCYAPAVQAADYFVRQQTGQMGLNELVVTAVDLSAEPRVEFATAEGLTYTVRLRTEEVPSLLAGCSKQKYEAQTFFHLGAIEQTPHL